MTTTGRRHADLIAQRKGNALLALCMALSLLATYVSYRAIRAMDDTTRYAADAYQLGKSLRKAPSYVPESDLRNE